jgi:hypothetical protein
VRCQASYENLSSCIMLLKKNKNIRLPCHCYKISCPVATTAANFVFLSYI